MPAIGRTFKVASASPYLALLQVIDTFLRDAGFQVPSQPPAAETDIIEARVAHYDPAGPFDDAPRFIIKAMPDPVNGLITMSPWHGARAKPLDPIAWGIGDYVSIAVAQGAQIHIAADGREGWAWMRSDTNGWTGISRIKRYPSDLTEGVAARFGQYTPAENFLLANRVLADGTQADMEFIVFVQASPLSGIDGATSKLTNLVAPVFLSSPYYGNKFQPHLLGELEDILKTSATGPFMQEVLPGFGLLEYDNGSLLLRRPAGFETLPDL